MLYFCMIYARALPVRSKHEEIKFSLIIVQKNSPPNKAGELTVGSKENVPDDHHVGSSAVLAS